MLIEFAVENFRSFAGRQTLNMLATPDDSLPQNVMEARGLRLVRAAGVYGPNASGKSNLISAFETLRAMVGISAGIAAERKLPLAPFLLRSDTMRAPTRLEATFISEGSTYRYGFSGTPKTVTAEWLFAYPDKRARLLFSRQVDKSGRSKWSWGRSYGGEKKRIASLTKAHSLFLSVASQFENKQLRPVADWFTRALAVQAGEPTQVATNRTFLDTAEPRNIQSTWKEAVLGFMEAADIHLSDFTVSRREAQSVKPPPNVPDHIVKFVLDTFGVDVRVKHRNKKTGQEMQLSLNEESGGTQRLFALSVPWITALAKGYVVFIDEIEASLHPLLTRRLIALFQSPRLIQKGAQLVFATHDTTLLDPELLRRDQVWLTEKDDEGATHLYSLSDYKERRVRKGEPLQKSYLAGRYGAIPILKSFGLHG